MPSKRAVAWSELKVGVLVIISLAILVAIVVLVLGVESPFARRYTLYTFLPNIGGLRQDSPVMLEGVTVGSVDSYEFAELEKGVRIKMRIMSKYENRIRTDSIAHLRSQGLLGDKYIEISQGTADGRVLKEGEAITGAPPLDLDEMIARANHTFDNLGDTVGNIKVITGNMKDGRGTVGKLLNDDQVYSNLNDILVKTGKGKGSVGKLINDDKFYNELSAMAANLRIATDNIKAGVGPAGKLLSDKELGEKLSSTISRLEMVASRMEKGEGTLGKLSKDDALYTNLNQVMANLKPVTDSLAKGEGTAGKLFKDKELYDNTNKTVQEIMFLVKDIRQDPKKYLRIRFSIF
jgi:phospholipid/cholesterol/gamma-HCH transport system substrate-binding protein